MIKSATKLFWLLFLITCAADLTAQDVSKIDMNHLNELKREGKLTGKENYFNSKGTTDFRVSPSTSNRTQAATNCECWLPRDASYQIAPFDGSGGNGGPGSAPDYRNDDWSTNVINLPFSFCFYGQQMNQVFINNNGNITFGNANPVFTATSFPVANDKMIAAFWADVDTRGALSGLVYYSLTPTHMVIQWENVGYFDSYTDKLNTFQMIITDGTDPLLPLGKNVSFCYKDMQWTTGDASGGGGTGFGGTPATVGANQGNGIDYMQFGLFDQPGALYDGAYGFNDGIDWLDNQIFTMDLCANSSNIPPVLNSLNICDTIRLCENNTYQLEAGYLSPEDGQTTNIVFNSNGMTGINLISNTPGNTANIILDVHAQNSNLGFHTITLTATDDGTPAGVTTSNITIEVLPAPLPSFTISPNDTVLVNTPISFTNTTAPGALLTWNFGDGSPNTSAINPQHAYTNAGDYIVSLSAMFPNGCSTVVTQNIHVTLCATASFTTSNACSDVGSAITYTGALTSTAIYSWDFNGGTILSGTGPGPYNIAWSTPGNYTVSLSVTDGGCVSSVSSQVIVFQDPVSSITPLQATLCAGDILNFNFNGNAGATASFNWNFGTGSIQSGTGAGPYDILWSNAVNDQVLLIVTENGCSDTARVPVIVNQIPVATFTIPPSLCTGDNLTVTYSGNASAGASYTWNFGSAIINSGSGSGPYNISFADSGNYSVQLSVIENNCPSSAFSLPVQVNATPVASISPVPAICPEGIASIIYNGTAGAGTVFQWSFGSGIVINGNGAGPYDVQWNNPGNESVSVIVNENGCYDTTHVSVLINPVPSSSFIAPPAACTGDSIAIVYSGGASAAAGYTWNFNGANIISGMGSGPYIISYSAGGLFNVDLTVSENGCVSPVTSVPLQINAFPVVTIDAANSVCPGINNVVNFSGAAGPNAIYAWTFGNGTVSSGSGPGPYNVSWNNSGPEIIHVDVNDNGCISSGDFNVTIYPVPTSDFTIDNAACEEEEISVVYTGTASSSAQFSWSFGSADIISGSNEGPYTLSFDVAGVMPVSLSVIENGCPSTPTIVQTTINDAPSVNAGNDITECSGVPISLGNPGIAGASYSWSPTTDLSDSGISDPLLIIINNTGVVQQRTYLVNVVDANGCINSDTVEVIINPTPVFSFPPQNGQCLEGNNFAFDGFSNIVSGVNYEWNFSGPSSVSSAHTEAVSVNYSTAGTYPVILQGNVNGCPGIPYVDSVIIFEMPASDFLPLITEGCAPLTVPFANSSTGNQNSYSWNFSDGEIDSIENAVHTFEEPGIYSVSLSAMNIHGCVANVIYRDIINVYPLPHGNFTPNPPVANILSPVFQFQNYSSNVATQYWDFGDNDTSNAWSPFHTYNDTGDYNISLILISADGCIDTVRGVVRVEDNFAFYVPNTFTPNGDGSNDMFSGYGIAFNSYSMQIFDRWGKAIYKTDDYNRPWDGRYNSDVVQNDTYVYRIVITDQHDKQHVFIGNVNVIK